MAYDTNELIERAVKAIKADKYIHFMYEVAIELGISRQTFYDKELDKVDTIRDALRENKARTRRKLRKDWEEEGSRFQEKLYKLLADDDELNRLNGNSVEVKTGSSGGGVIIEIKQYNKDEEDDN